MQMPFAGFGRPVCTIGIHALTKSASRCRSRRFLSWVGFSITFFSLPGSRLGLKAWGLTRIARYGSTGGPLHSPGTRPGSRVACVTRSLSPGFHVPIRPSAVLGQT